MLAVKHTCTYHNIVKLDPLYSSLAPTNMWAEIVPSDPEGFFGAYEYVREFTDQDSARRMRFGQKARILHLSRDKVKKVVDGNESIIDELVASEPETPGLFLVKNTCRLVTVDNIVLPVPGNPAQLFEFSPVRN
jgi:hypothetical protein